MTSVSVNSVFSRKLRVGVSMHVRAGGQSLWENGIYQNCIFLVMLLMRSPIVSETYLVVDGATANEVKSKEFLQESPVPVIGMSEAATTLDVMIEMSAQLKKDWIVSFREHKGKVVSMRVGNDYVIDVERMTFGKPNGMLIPGEPYDAIWTLPQYEKIGAPYYGSAFRAPVRILGHLWSPVFLQREIANLPSGSSFGYQPEHRRWRVGIFEPNLCLVKTSFIPMLCCEAAHRANPDFLEYVRVYNTLAMKENATFGSFARSLDIVKHGLASFEGRFPLYRVVASDVDAIVSHQWENAQNYVYYEALFGAYPLVHNSHLIGDCGYRYHDFDCEEGALALQRAYMEHDANLDHYRRTAGEFLRGLAPENEANVRAYTEAIASLYNEP